MKITFSTTATLALVASLAVGCVPDRENQIVPEGQQQLAVLTTDGYGLDIVIFDAHGNTLDRIETEVSAYAGNQSLGYHPDGFFLVSDGQEILRVERNGDVSVFNQEPIWGGIWGVSVSDEGDVTTGNAESGVTKLDPEGEIILFATMGGTCFMDAAPIPGERGRDASIDIYGPRIVAADTETGELEVLVQGVGNNTDKLAVDERGNFFAVSSWTGRLYHIADGQSEEIVNLNTSLDAYQVRALTTAGARSVFALVEDSAGSRIVQVDDGGNITDFATGEYEIWTDIVRF